MKNLKHTLERTILAVAAFLFPAACIPVAMYGAPLDVEFGFKTVDTNSDPIEGLKMTVSDGATNLAVLTGDTNGEAHYFYMYGYVPSDNPVTGSSNLTLKIEDTDGVSNGGLFTTVTTNINITIPDYTITLKRE